MLETIFVFSESAWAFWQRINADNRDRYLTVWITSTYPDIHDKYDHSYQQDNWEIFTKVTEGLYCMKGRFIINYYHYNIILLGGRGNAPQHLKVLADELFWGATPGNRSFTLRELKFNLHPGT